MSFRFRSAFLAAIAAGSPALAAEDVMVVFDGSNSMWGQIDGTAKIEIARGVMDNLLGDWTEERNVGLMAYGHRRRGDCSDIEVLVPPGTGSRQDILDRIDAITPTGKTPLTAAVEQAARELSYTDRPATVVLISDGLESCDRDPCALADTLEKSGVAFTAHVVGFGLGADEDTASLACIADRTGGQYVSASNAQELAEALNVVATAVAVPEPKPEPEPALEPEPAPEPQPEPEPAAQIVTVTGPAVSIGGADITVTWAPDVAEGDYITVVPAATATGEFGPYVRIGKAEEVTLPVPGDEGLYEIRYVSNATKDTLGSAALEVTRPEVTLNAADSVQTGGEIGVSWTPTINRRDYITVVPMGAAEGEFGNYAAIHANSEVTLQAPATPGVYEIRYVLNVDKRTVASRALEVTDPQVVLRVPETALTGARFDIGWAGAVNPRDYITIVPVGTDAGVAGNYITVRDDATGALRAPAETGMYEVRYVLREGGKTLASEMIEITAPEVTVSGPETAVTGSKIDVSWTGTVSDDDYVTIVPVGTDEGAFGNYVVVRDTESAALIVPGDTGMYELRYVLREGGKTLATATIEVTEPEVTVTAPDTALAGAVIEVSWTGTVNTNDYVTIVPVGTEEGQSGNYISVRSASSDTLQAPTAPGMYEVRYVLREGNRTLASTMIELTEPAVGIRAPEAVRAGDTLPVSWTGAVNRSDYVTLVPVGTPDDEYGAYFQVREQTERDMTAPEETGMYELRYVLREGDRVLARQLVEVLAADAGLDTGSSLTVPDTAAPGAAIVVSWTGDSTSADRRLTLARPDQAIFTWISATRITSGPPLEITLPEAPGVYEIRLLDVSNQAVLSRRIVRVE